MRMFKYVCEECDMDFWTDVPEADYCCNCGSPKIEEDTYDQDDLNYLKRSLMNIEGL